MKSKNLINKIPFISCLCSLSYSGILIIGGVAILKMIGSGLKSMLL